MPKNTLLKEAGERRRKAVERLIKCGLTRAEAVRKARRVGREETR